MKNQTPLCLIPEDQTHKKHLLNSKSIALICPLRSTPPPNTLSGRPLHVAARSVHAEKCGRHHHDAPQTNKVGSRGSESVNSEKAKEPIFACTLTLFFSKFILPTGQGLSKGWKWRDHKLAWWIRWRNLLRHRCCLCLDKDLASLIFQWLFSLGGCWCQPVGRKRPIGSPSHICS